MKIHMSIHQALSTLKVLESRIEHATKEKFIEIKKGESQTISGIQVLEVERNLKANLQKVLQLIENRKALRAAVVASNAKTEITIEGKTFVVADAIERKANMYQEEALLEQLKKQYLLIKNQIDQDEKVELPRKLEAYLTSILGNSNDRKPEDIKLHSEDFIKKSALKIVDPNKLFEFIDKYEKELTEFKNTVDYKLSESNAVTHIEVEYTSI